MLALTLGAASALPATLSTQSGVTTLRGTVARWSLGKRTLAVVDGSPARELTRGVIDAQGRFQIALPTPAQLSGLTRRAGDEYDVVGCDDQPSDFDVSGWKAAIYTLPELRVLKARPPRAAPYETQSLLNLPAAGEITLMYASEDVFVKVNVTCMSRGDQNTTVFDLHLNPGWTAVLSHAGKDWVVEAAPATLPSRWVYRTR